MYCKFPSRKIIVLTVTGLIPLLLVIGVILFNSRQDRTTSKAMSRKFSYSLEKKIDVQSIYKWILDTRIIRNVSPYHPRLILEHGHFHAALRKAAHIIEYTGLGFILGLTCFFIRIKWYVKVPGMIMFFVGFPVFDELVQRYSHRMFRVFDICMDMLGETIGLFLAFAIIGFFCTIFRGTKPRPATSPVPEQMSQPEKESQPPEPLKPLPLCTDADLNHTATIGTVQGRCSQSAEQMGQPPSR